MTAHTFPTRHFVGLVGSFFGHVVALIVGFILMVVGLALGVTMVMLPVGLALGLLGFLIFLGGLFARIGNEA